MKIDERRVHTWISGSVTRSGPVVYWMSRDQRSRDNWALFFALNEARVANRDVRVVFTLSPHFLGATLRQYDFMIAGLREVEHDLNQHGISFEVLLGNPVETINSYIEKNEVSCLVTDFSPLKISQTWKRSVSKHSSIPFYEVDAHNVIPCRFISQKQEFSARTIRTKVQKYINEFLTDIPRIPHVGNEKKSVVDWDGVIASLDVRRDVLPVSIVSGMREAQKKFHAFRDTHLSGYATRRNDPNEDGQSGLSPYLHFGQISAQRVAYEIKTHVHTPDADVFLEELIVRRELADNFCFYNSAYDSVAGFPAWARATLDAHRNDPRDYVYTKKQFERAETHDPLWNSAQIEMIETGKMHGYLRMYWAKKILEWTASPEDAMDIAIYLNDTYELDGRDPNGYAGIAWSIGGVHDRPWFVRPVYGTIRYMNASGASKKFDTKSYIAKFSR